MATRDFSTPRQALDWMSRRFASAGIQEAAAEARALVRHLFGSSTSASTSELDRPLEPAETERAHDLIRRRLEGEPLPYLVGSCWFRSLRLVVDPRVLIPRPATEILVDLVASALRDRPAPAMADVCTGSGVVALSVAVELPAARVVATDLSPDALAVARENVERLQAVGRARNVELRQGDLLAPLASERFDVIASNPPYIPSEDMLTLPHEVLREPRLALESGADGLDAIRRLVAGARANLVPGGLLAIEHGVGQDRAVAALFEAAGYVDIRSQRDQGDVLRVTAGRVILAPG